MKRPAILAAVLSLTLGGINPQVGHAQGARPDGDPPWLVADNKAGMDSGSPSGARTNEEDRRMGDSADMRGDDKRTGSGKASMDWSDANRDEAGATNRGTTNQGKTDTTSTRKITSPDQELDRLVRDSAQSFRQVQAGGEGEKGIPRSLLSKAECVAVFPHIVDAAFVVGARHGDGIVSCKSNNRWSRVAFLNLSGGSFGAQIGASSTDLVLLFMNQNARAKLESGEFTLGADASVVAGDVDRSADINTDRNDIVAFAHREGAYVGATLNGTVVNADTDDLANFYRENLQYRQVFRNSDIPSQTASVRDFIALLPGENRS